MQRGRTATMHIAETQTLADRIERAAGGGGSVTFVVGGTEERVAYGRLHKEACAAAAALQARGVAPGSHVALLGPTTRQLFTTIEAVWLAGATLVVLPLPMRLGSIEEFAAATRRRMAAADVTLIVVDPDLAPFIEPEPADPPFVLLSDLFAPGAGSAYERPAFDPDATAVLQFTSGSTADPKGVVLPNRAICANLDAVAIAAELDAGDDTLVSWLPLYHDMGLVGFGMLPLTTGTDLVLGAPTDFLGAPIRWMEWLSAYGGTATAGPNFSWVLATRALRNASGLDLSRMRVGLNGAEPVDADAVERFIAAAAPHGFPAGAVFPAFGMAEVVIAGAFPPPMRGLATDLVDRLVLEKEQYAAPAAAATDGTRRLVRLGRPVPGLEMRFVDPETGTMLGEREVGELQLRGTSVTPGYYGRPDVTAEAFAVEASRQASPRSYAGEWLRTGDLGYSVDGELVLCGRIKDMIIVGGRNVFPEDIERAVGDVDGVRAGNVIAFGIERGGKEGVAVVCETKHDDHTEVRRLVAASVVSSVGFPAKDVVLVAPGTLPKTSSGKLQRTLCRERYLDGALA